MKEVVDRLAFPVVILLLMGLVTVAVVNCGSGAPDTNVPGSFPLYPEPDLPPQMNASDCKFKDGPTLPSRWTATALMAPYLYSGENFADGADLHVGHFEYQNDTGLMRVTTIGVRNPLVADDVLITRDGPTYKLKGDYENPTCHGTLPKPLPFPSRRWVSPTIHDGSCVGHYWTAPAMNRTPASDWQVDWWKQSSPVTMVGAQGQAADWYWFNEKGFPTRTMFWGNNPQLPAVLGEYAFSNFYDFTPGSTQNLEKILEKCQGLAQVPALARGHGIDPEHLADPQFRAEQVARFNGYPPVDHFIPGLSSCSSSATPSWPENVYISSYSTAAKYDTSRPLPTSVYYNTSTPAIRTRLHKDGGSTLSDAVLYKTGSFGVDFVNGTGQQTGCAQGPLTSLPGSPKPDWGSEGGCQCMAQISDNDVFSPGRTTRIYGCPLQDYSGPTIFWMWYVDSQPQEPVVFMQTRPDVTVGTGLSLADYVTWQEPPSVFPSDIFTLPTNGCVDLCRTSPAPQQYPKACAYCHLPSKNCFSGPPAAKETRWERWR